MRARSRPISAVPRAPPPRAGTLVTLGVAPTRPETGYGYIRRGDPVGPHHPGMFRVRRFVEKPDALARAALFALG